MKEVRDGLRVHRLDVPDRAVLLLDRRDDGGVAGGADEVRGILERRRRKRLHEAVVETQVSPAPVQCDGFERTVAERKLVNASVSPLLSAHT